MEPAEHSAVLGIHREADRMIFVALGPSPLDSDIDRSFGETRGYEIEDVILMCD
jgi:hypothetical protein